MRVDPMWAGQYLLLDELWRGRERIVYDPLLNNVLLAPGGDGLAWDREGRVHGLLEALLASDSAGVWLLFEDLEIVARAGVDTSVFVARSLSDGARLAHRRRWETAMVDVSEVLDELVERGQYATASRFGHDGAAMLVDALLESVTPDRALVLWTRADASEPGDSARLVALRRLCKERCGLPIQLVGLSHASVLQAFPLSTRSDDDGGYGIDVDNRLGTDHPEFRYYMAVLGPQVPPGITVVELPAASASMAVKVTPKPPTESLSSPPKRPTSSPDTDWVAERLLLQEQRDHAERQLEESEQGRMTLLRDLDRATQHIAELEDELDDLRDPPGASDEDRDEDAHEPEGELAEQALVLQAAWELEQLRAQVTALRARPVSELEAENAALRAKLTSLGASIDAPINAPDTSVKEAQAGTSSSTFAASASDSATGLAPEPAIDFAEANSAAAFSSQELSVATETQDVLLSSEENVRLKSLAERSERTVRENAVGGERHSPITYTGETCATLYALSTDLHQLRHRLERGGLEPLRLQTSLKAFEKVVLRLLRDGQKLRTKKPRNS